MNVRTAAAAAPEDCLLLAKFGFLNNTFAIGQRGKVTIVNIAHRFVIAICGRLSAVK